MSDRFQSYIYPPPAAAPVTRQPNGTGASKPDNTDAETERTEQSESGRANVAKTNNVHGFADQSIEHHSPISLTHDKWHRFDTRPHN